MIYELAVEIAAKNEAAQAVVAARAVLDAHPANERGALGEWRTFDDPDGWFAKCHNYQSASTTLEEEVVAAFKAHAVAHHVRRDDCGTFEFCGVDVEYDATFSSRPVVHNYYLLKFGGELIATT